MENNYKEILIKNILCAIGAGVIINVGSVDTVAANEMITEGMNVTADKIPLEVEKMKNIANDVIDINTRLSNISKIDNKYDDKINKDEVLIDLEEKNFFNPYTKLKCKSVYMIKDEDEEKQNFEEFNDDIEILNNEFIGEENNSIDENVEVEIDESRNNVKRKVDIKENDTIKDVSQIKTNTVVSMENKYNVLDWANKDRKIAQEKAVVTARNGDYDEALLILQSLYNSDKSDMSVAYDYMTVLNWAGKYKEAVEVFESNNYKDTPEYVKINIAGAYYRLNLFDKVIDITEPLIERKDKEAELLLAQTYLKMNRVKDADDIYNKLIIEYPDDMEIYLNRAQMSSSMANWLRAVRDWNDVLNLYEKNPDNQKITKQQILDNLSAAYIHMARFKEIVQILKPYVESEVVSSNVVGNYIIALNNINQYKEAQKIYSNFFSEYSKAPVFVTRELINSYVMTKDYQHVVDICKYLVELPNSEVEDKFNFAYYACLSGVEKNKGIKMYRNILLRKDARKYTTKILNQAQDFLNKGYYNIAKKIYYELINYDKRFHNIYASDLVTERQYQSALHEYYAMTRDKDLKKVGIEGIVQVSVLLKDYKTAEDRLKQLSEEFENITYDKAKGSFINKQKGEVDFNVFNYSDYDDSNETDVNVFVKQYIDDSFWIESSTGKTYIKDIENGDNTVLNTNRIGLRYITQKWDTLLAWNMFDIDSGNKNGLYFNMLFRPTDRQNINFIYSYEPIYDVDALDYENGSIFGDNYVLRYVYDLNRRESYYLELRKSEYTDDNKKYGWEIGQQYNIYNEKEKKGRTLDRSIFWSRDRYSNQDVPYTSPKLSENFGGEWKWGLDLGHDDTLYYILGTNWKRDYPDKLAFSPYIGIEYNKYIGNYNFYSISASYGWRTENWLGKGDWEYDNKQISFSYNITW